MMIEFFTCNEEGDIVRPMKLVADSKESLLENVQKLADINQQVYEYELKESSEWMAKRKGPGMYDENGMLKPETTVIEWSIMPFETGRIEPRVSK